MRGSASAGDVEYVIASTVDLGVRTDIGFAGTSQAAAEAALAAHLAANPSEIAALQVMPAHEAVVA
jgi:hypothetical protein